MYNIFGRATVILSHLVVFNNSAKQGGSGIAASLRGGGRMILIIQKLFFISWIWWCRHTL